MVDEGTRKTLSSIPLLQTKAGPRDKELWPTRLKEEYQALIKYVQNNKAADNDWFRLESDKTGTKWFGKCWYVHNLLKYEFDLEFDHSATSTALVVASDRSLKVLVELHKEQARRWAMVWDEAPQSHSALSEYPHRTKLYLQRPTWLLSRFRNFQIPITYPTTAPELALPGLDGKTAKMYRGGKICLTDHFKPLWARNIPRFGIAHAMALGLGPWLAVEIPELIEKGVISYQEKTEEAK